MSVEPQSAGPKPAVTDGGVEKRILAAVAWPELITAGLCLAAIASAPFYGIAPVIAAVVAGSLEHFFPFRKQRWLHATWRTDAYHAILTSALAGGFTGLTVITVGEWLRVLAAPYVAPLHHQPLIVQVVEVIAVYDLAAYVFHRAEHRFRWLWRFHSVHHSIEDLNWLAAYRVHPVDSTLNGIVAFIPVYVLGLWNWPAVLLFFTVVESANTPWAHGNLRVSLGPLWWLVRNPEVHRWHHSVAPAARDKNFGQTFMIWDVLFRTAYFPRDREVGRLGLPVPAPPSYAGQLLMPFTPEYADSGGHREARLQRLAVSSGGDR